MTRRKAQESISRKAIFGHLSVPALFTLVVFAYILTREAFGMEMFAAYVIMSGLFYAAPHLLWLVVAGIGKFPRMVWHAGFIAASIALFAIALFWLLPRDPSALPLQWVLYWPLALAMQIVFVCVCNFRTHPAQSE